MGGEWRQNNSIVNDDACISDKKDYASGCNSTVADRWAILIDQKRAVLCFAVVRSRKDQGTAGLLQLSFGSRQSLEPLSTCCLQGWHSYCPRIDADRSKAPDDKRMTDIYAHIYIKTESERG